MLPMKPRESDLDKLLAAERSEVQLKLYEHTKTFQYTEAMLAYYETRLATLNEQIARCASKLQEGTTTPILI